MNAHIPVFKRILSVVKGLSIKLRDKFEYESVYGYDDFTDNQLINKRALAGRSIGNKTVVSLTGTDPQVFDYVYPGDVSGAAIIQIYAEQLYTDPDLGEDVLTPYTCNYKKIASTHTIQFIRGDAGDIVNYTIIQY